MKSCNLWTLTLGLLFSISGHASIGKVTELVNTPPSITRQNSTITGAKGTGLEMNDSVKTSQGKVGITFDDDTRLQVNENSKLVIDDFVYDPKKGSGKLGAKIALGTVRYASGQIAKNTPQNVNLSTPTATVSVRGTDFTASVDEVGASTFVLLPSCPNDRPTRTKRDIETNCKVGEIVVESDAGQVILNQAFQATKVTNRNQPPSRPVILNLSEDAISHMIIISPPRELRSAAEQRNVINGILDRDFLKFEGLENVLEAQMASMFADRLSQNFLDNGYLANLLDMMNLLNENLLGEVDTMLPDYRKSSGIVVFKDDPTVTLCRDDGSNIQCVTTPQTQNSTIIQTQGIMEFKNRVNQGGNTIITLIQR